MQFRQFIVALAMALPASMAASLQERAVACTDATHPCNTYFSYPDCSVEYIKDLTLCQQSGCIQWIRDPLEHCSCGATDNACNTYTKYATCSAEWIADVEECKRTGCLQWIRDPLEDC